MNLSKRSPSVDEENVVQNYEYTIEYTEEKCWNKSSGASPLFYLCEHMIKYGNNTCWQGVWIKSFKNQTLCQQKDCAISLFYHVSVI